MAKGFYVDVGCFHPVRLSNTLWFYRNGWRGINIDPTPGVKQQFDRWRPRDLNLQLAISDREGSLTFYTEGGRPSVYNTANQEQAQRLVAQGTIKNLVALQVPCATLASVLDQHVPTGQVVDFLTVDAEEHDLQVLKSNDWRRHRPEVVLVEAHCDRMESLMASELVAFMRTCGYSIHAWLRPNLLLKPDPATA